MGRTRLGTPAGRLGAVALLTVVAVLAAVGCTGEPPADKAQAAILATATKPAGDSSSEPAPATSAPPSAPAAPAAPAADARLPDPVLAPRPPATLRPEPPPPPRKPLSKAAIDIRVGAAGAAAAAVRLDAPVVASVRSGRFTSVSMTKAGARVAGFLNAGSTSWTGHGPLAPASTYTITAQALDADGVPATKRFSFTTLRPSAVLRTRIAPLNGETVGVAMPVIVYFNHAVSNRAAVERRLRVTSSKGSVGGWNWLSSSEVHYRPKVYWKSGERVLVDVALAGVDAGAGLWGVQSRWVSFAIGRSHVSLVSAAKHTMTSKEDGKVVRSFKVSTGRDLFPTSSGVHVVMSKDKVYWMDSATIGIPRDDPEGYYKMVQSSVRISNSGEFVHAAPWSTKDQGLRNVSHGCINASVADAAWFMRFSRRGDVVEVVGTPRRLQLGNGFADWTVPWRTWVKGSALAKTRPA